MNSKEGHPILYQTLKELVIALSEQEKANYNDIIGSTHLPSIAFESCCSWSEDCYTRNCIVENEKFELILLCWEKGQITPIHDHGDEECWVKIIQGEFRETIYQVDEANQLNEVKSSISKAGDISYMVDFMGCHRLENLSEERSMSLHLYAKPIRTCRLFDEDSSEFVLKELEYNTVSEMMTTLKK